MLQINESIQAAAPKGDLNPSKGSSDQETEELQQASK